jgi:4-methylaminobutanoate oxidase (formaldehyde-forming)
MSSDTLDSGTVSQEKFPSQARVVIIGGGVVGCSLAYHLTRLGWRDVVLLERRQLTCGTTWHAAGLVGQLRATQNMTRLAQYTTNLYKTLEQETGQATGFRQHGSLSLATNAARLEELRRGASMARVFGLEVAEISVDEARRRWPLLNTDDVVGAVFLPGDGQTNPVDTTMALAKGARQGGARILEHTQVTAIHTRPGGRVPVVTGVSTNRGDIAAEVVVNCAGMWGRQVGAMAGVNVPLHACEHFYVVTGLIDGLPPDLPVLRDTDSCAYYKGEAGKLLLGAFEPNAKPWGMQGIPEDFCFDQLPDDLAHFEPVLEAAMHRVPVLAEAGIQTFFNGPESFTPDNRYLLGEAPELRNLYVAAGFNSIGIQSAGGAGKVLAEWIAAGHAPMDLWDVDIRRMFPFQGEADYLFKRATEALGLLYAMHWPYRQYETARGIRLSPLHDRLAAVGACFGEVAGWERANWFAPAGVAPHYAYSYGRQNWFPHAAEEHRAVREAVGLFDQTSFAKYVLAGPDAEAVLQRICANDVAVPVGRVVYTPWLNDRGGIEADLTVTRLADDRYAIVTSAATAGRDWHWLWRHLPEDARVTLHDETDEWAVLSVMGPHSRALLGEVTRADLGNGAFPFATMQQIELAGVPVRAQRITYVGELGWELYVPAAQAVAVFDALWAAGPAHGLRLCGMHVLDSCRIEKAYRHWGHDISDEDTPLAAGLAWTCAWDKGADFLGREALLPLREQPLTRRLVQFALDDPQPLLYHNEPIWRDGEIVGHLTSGNYGHHLGCAIGLGYVHHAGGVDADFVRAGRYEIEVACERYPARASLRPLYDPRGERVRA